MVVDKKGETRRWKHLTRQNARRIVDFESLATVAIADAAATVIEVVAAVVVARKHILGN